MVDVRFARPVLPTTMEGDVRSTYGRPSCSAYVDVRKRKVDVRASGLFCLRRWKATYVRRVSYWPANVAGRERKLDVSPIHLFCMGGNLRSR